jgi:hypothetical protein
MNLRHVKFSQPATTLELDASSGTSSLGIWVFKKGAEFLTKAATRNRLQLHIFGVKSPRITRLNPRQPVLTRLNPHKQNNIFSLHLMASLRAASQLGTRNPDLLSMRNPLSSIHLKLKTSNFKLAEGAEFLTKAVLNPDYPRLVASLPPQKRHCNPRTAILTRRPPLPWSLIILWSLDVGAWCFFRRLVIGYLGNFRPNDPNFSFSSHFVPPTLRTR